MLKLNIQIDYITKAVQFEIILNQLFIPINIRLLANRSIVIIVIDARPSEHSVSIDALSFTSIC